MSLDNKLKKWLNDQGYPLEMQVASAFRQEGFSVSQGDYYSDPETKKPREIDVVATKSTFLGVLDYYVCISLVIECKLSIDKPWIIFTGDSEKVDDESRLSLRICSKLGQDYLFDLASSGKSRELPIFYESKYLGYGITQAFTNREDVPYRAVLSCLKASIARKKQANNDKFFETCEILFPVVVVDGLLYECFINSSGETVLNQIERGLLLWKNKLAGHSQCIVPIVTMDALPLYAKEASDSVNWMINDCEARLFQIAKKSESYRNQSP